MRRTETSCESIAQNHPGLQRKTNIIIPTVLIIIIWFIAVGSLLGIHYFFKKKPKINKTAITKIEAKLKSLTDEQKTKMRYFESGIVELASGDLRIVDSGLEDDEIMKSGVSERKIEFHIDDPLFLERQMIIREAFRKLNNAEKHCVTDMHAVILYRDGACYLVFDPKIYKQYIFKYGNECKSCEDKKIIKMKGEMTNEKMD
jgi:hypothetical protein